MTDIELILGTTLTMAGFWLALEDADRRGSKLPQWSKWRAGTLFFGGVILGLLAKGPVALVLSGAPIFVWIVYNRRWLDTWRRLPWIGGQPTEADIRLFPTLARFDAVYYLHFKCNLRRLVDYQSLWGYARDLFQRPGFGETTDFGQIKRHYYQSQAWINPSRIVPKGPFVSWLEPHGRDRLSG
jgi:hypothetical protein